MRQLAETVCEWALEQREMGIGWKRLAKSIGCSPVTLRYNIDPAFRRSHDEKVRATRNATEEYDYRELLPVEDGIPRNPEFDPARDGPPVWESKAAEFMGDPPLGRRAIDRR